MMPMSMPAAAAGNSYSNDMFEATFEKPSTANNNNNDNVYMQPSAVATGAAAGAGSDNKPFIWESFDDEAPEKAS